jgi:hypothetical protein
VSKAMERKIWMPFRGTAPPPHGKMGRIDTIRPAEVHWWTGRAGYRSVSGLKEFIDSFSYISLGAELL